VYFREEKTMKRTIYIFLIAIIAFSIAGCESMDMSVFAKNANTAANLANPTQVGELQATVQALPSEMAANIQNVDLTETAPAPDTQPASISITSISDAESGKAVIKWKAEGDFPQGFKVVWSDKNPNPTFPDDTWQYVSDPSARQTTVDGAPGKTYMFRVCQYDGSGCAFYSLPFAFKFAKAPEPTSDTSKINIVGITNKSSGKAEIEWAATGSFPNGFKVVWSATNNAPTYPEDTWLYISDSSARTTIVTGTPGTQYYFRVCKYNGSSCDFYSPAFKFTFAGSAPTESGGALTITRFSDESSGQAVIHWNAVGDFPNGFKVAWSATNHNPTYPADTWIYISDPDAREATVTGDPGTKYYFRLCKYNGSGCAFYSPAVSYVFTGTTTTEEAVSIDITGITDTASGKANITWNATGSFPNGFKVAWSATNHNPTYPADTWVYISNGSARSAQVTGDPGKTYYFRVCKYTGAACSNYSAAYTFTFAGSPPATEAPTEVITETPLPPDTSSISITGISAGDPGSASVTWDASGSFPNGFKLVWSDSSHAPVYPGDNYQYLSDPGARSGSMTGLESGKTYYFRVCKYTGDGCSNYSGVQTYTAP
jgi:hypothetical protein